MTARRLVWFAVLAACTSGAPPGFTGGAGDRWSFPLVGPLEGGVLLAPVVVGVKGPYLFALDPDAPISSVDGEIVKEAGLRTFHGPRRLDESDTQQVRHYAEVVGLELGTLVIERTNLMIVAPRTFDANGRRIVGLIGRDVLVDSLAFGFDRDQGLGHLIVQKSFKASPEAVAIRYQTMRSRVTNAETVPDDRRLAKATIGGAQFELHLDLGAPASQLRDSEWETAKLVARDLQTAVIDEVGSARRIVKASEPTSVTVGGATAERVVFVPYGDQRWDEHEIDGTLGLDFFAEFSVWVSWHTKTYHLVKRREVAAATRIGRWDMPVLSRCTAFGCVTVRVIDPLNGAAPPEGKPHPGLVLSVTREEPAGGLPLEVVLEPKTKPELPRLLVNLPANVDKVISQLKAEFLGVTLEVVDVSPFPRACPTPAGCVDLLAR